MNTEYIILLIVNERLYKTGIISDEQRLKVLDQILSGNIFPQITIDRNYIAGYNRNDSALIEQMGGINYE